MLFRSVSQSRYAQGDGPTQRNGRQLTIKSIQMRLTIKQDGDSDHHNSAIRVILIQDKQANGASPALSDIVNGANTTVLTNLDNRQRFQILYDETYLIGGTLDGTLTGAAGGLPRAYCNFYRKYNITTTFKGNDNSIGSIATNAIYLMCYIRILNVCFRWYADYIFPSQISHHSFFKLNRHVILAL